MQIYFSRFSRRSRMLSLVLVFLLLLMPTQAFADEYGIVQGGMLHLRATPSTSGTLLGSYPTGTWVQVLEQGRDWHKVQIGNQIGYMSAAYVSFENITEIVDARVSGASGYINLRAEPSMGSASLGRYTNGTKVTILSQENGWYHVKVGNLTGYMVDTLVKLETTQVSTYAAVQTNTGSSVNVRRYPTTQAQVLTSVRPGDQVKILAKGKDWHKVQVRDITGYMSAQFLSIGSSSSGGGTPAPAGTYAVVNNPISTQVLMLRQTPSTSAKVLGNYRNGTRVEVLEYLSDWTKVKVDGTTGYMMTKYLKVESGGTGMGTTATIYNPNGGSYVNFRAQPGLSTRIIGTPAVGTVVTVLAKYTDWTMVRIGESTGYISTYFLRFSN